MLTKEPPPVVVDPNVERLLAGDMLKIRDIVLDCAVKVSDAKGVPIKEIRVALWQSPEDDWEDVDFDILLVCDQETAFAYWDGIDEAIDEYTESMSEEVRYMFNYHVSVWAHWL